MLLSAANQYQLKFSDGGLKKGQSGGLIRQHKARQWRSLILCLLVFILKDIPSAVLLV